MGARVGDTRSLRLCPASALLLLLAALLLAQEPSLSAIAAPADSAIGAGMSGVYKRARSLVPRLDRAKHKGQAGRVGVVGGSLEYTGAPYYAAIAALRCGADLAFVFCGEPGAAGPIKSYSPELIVYPELGAIDAAWGRLSALVVGPGLGRDAAVLEKASLAIAAARAAGVPLVLDGDALWLVKDRPDLVRGYKRAILTPNAAEFDRLHRAAFADEPAPTVEPLAETSPAGVALDPAREPALSVARVSDWLEGVTVVRKGPVDIISNGAAAVGCVGFGSARRCGGQGDVLAGSTGVFLGWAVASSPQSPDTLAAAYGAALLTRRANQLAFERHGRSTTTPEMIDILGSAFHGLYDDEKSPFCSL